MNYIRDRKYIVNPSQLQNIFQKHGISCSKPINEEEFVKEVYEITQTVSVYSSSGDNLSITQ